MRWIMFFVIFIGISALLSVNVYAANWDTPPVLITSTVEDYSNDLLFVCGAEVKAVRVSREPNTIRACVYGEPGGVQVARYPGNYGDYLLAISYPLDTQFYTIEGVCNENSPCVYSQASDTLYTTTGGGVHNTGLLEYPSFSKQLQRHTSRVGPYFTPTAYFKTVYQESGFPVRSLAVSRTGQWIVVEHPGKGIVRMDTTTGERRRIRTTHYDDSRGRFAISSDGSAVAAAGEGRRVEIISIDGACGDDVREGLGSQFPQHVRQCQVVSPEVHRHTPGAVTVSHPVFYGTDRLYLQIYTRTGIIGSVYASAATVDGGEYSYIALGDSFTSGEGETDDSRYFSYSNEGYHGCHVSDRSYPYLLAQVPLIQTIGVAGVYSAACSGATIADITGSNGYMGQGSRLLNEVGGIRSTLIQQALVDGLRGIIPQVDFIERHQPQYVTIGIGGNDVGFSGKLKSCLGLDICEWAKPGDGRKAVAREIDSLEGKLIDMVESVVRTSNAKVYLVGYPQLIRESEDAKCTPFIGALLEPTERLFIGKSITRINQVIKGVAQNLGVNYLDIEDAYGSHRLCDDTKTPAMNGIRVGDDMVIAGMKIIGAESFHPTPYGHELVSSRIASLLGVQQTVFRGSFQQEDEYWSEGGEAGEGYRYILNSPVERKVNTGTREYEMTIAPGTFDPLSSVKVGVQGDSPVLYTVRANGGLTAKMLLSDHINKGVIVVQAIGDTVAGEKVALYEIVTAVPTDTLGGEYKSGFTDTVKSGASSGLRAVVSQRLAVNAEVPIITPNSRIATESAPGRLGSKREVYSKQLISYWWVGGVLVAAASLTLLLYRRYNK